jgi:hypothetical protein
VPAAICDDKGAKLCWHHVRTCTQLQVGCRCLHIFWWEPLVAAYFVLAPAALAWSIIGLTWAAKSADARHIGESQQCVSFASMLVRDAL